METRDLFRLRSYQRPSREARARGCRKFIKLWHRRAGKDRDSMAFILEESIKRVGNYIHVFPSLNQGRRDVWNNTVQQRYDGREVSVPLISMFPPEIVRRRDASEMFFEFTYGSSYQIMGADDDDAVDRLRGPNPIGVVMSEYAHGSKMKKAYDTLIPVLAENGGWIIFAYTPNGFNHGYDLWEAAVRDSEHWFTQKLTIDDTLRDAVGEDGSPVVTLEEIEGLRRNGVREEFIQQEFYCSFTGFEHGTIYGDLLLKARNDARILRIPYTVNRPVGICIDLGQSDAMAVWFYQRQGNAVYFIDYWESTQKSIKDVVRMLREEKQYIYGRVILPWDGRSAADYMHEMGFRNIHITERSKSIQADIEIVRREFSRFYFDEVRCAVGIEHLRQYKREWDDEAKVFSGKPVHDHHSHAADALRCGVMGGFDPLMHWVDFSQPVKVISDFDPRIPIGGA